MKPKNTFFKKQIVYTVKVAIICILLFLIAMFWKVLAINMNPDGVNLKNGNWDKIFSYTTHKGTDIDLFARKGKKPNSGEFVIARKWFFNRVQLISPVLIARNIWKVSPLYPAKGYDAGVIYEFDIDIGYVFGDKDMFKYRLAPSLCLNLYQNRQTGKFHFFGLMYLHCDELPILEVFKSALSEPEINYGCKKPMIHNNPLQTIPFESENDY